MTKRREGYAAYACNWIIIKQEGRIAQSHHAAVTARGLVSSHLYAHAAGPACKDLRLTAGPAAGRSRHGGHSALHHRSCFMHVLQPSMPCVAHQYERWLVSSRPPNCSTRYTFPLFLSVYTFSCWYEATSTFILPFMCSQKQAPCSLGYKPYFFSQ